MFLKSLPTHGLKKTMLLMTNEPVTLYDLIIKYSLFIVKFSEIYTYFLIGNELYVRAGLLLSVHGEGGKEITRGSAILFSSVKL
jgi:hypothetical protein